MMKSEFESIFGGPVSTDDYDKIETVYLYYPGIEYKEEIAKLVKIGGMLLINDMLGRAKAIKKLEDEISENKSRLKELKCL